MRLLAGREEGGVEWRAQKKEMEKRGERGRLGHEMGSVSRRVRGSGRIRREGNDDDDVTRRMESIPSLCELAATTTTYFDTIFLTLPPFYPSAVVAGGVLVQCHIDHLMTISLQDSIPLYYTSSLLLHCNLRILDLKFM